MALALERLASPADPEQALAPDQVDHECDVDDEGRDLDVGHVLAELVYLERQEQAGADGGDVLTPSLEAPEPDALGELEQGVTDQERLDEVQSPVARVQQAADVGDRRALVEVVVEGRGRAFEPRKLFLEELLKRG